MMFLYSAAGLFGLCSKTSEKFLKMSSICQNLVLRGLQGRASYNTLHLQREDPVAQLSVIS